MEWAVMPIVILSHKFYSVVTCECVMELRCCVIWSHPIDTSLLFCNDNGECVSHDACVVPPVDGGDIGST